MLYNQKTALSTSKILLVPYCKHHVPRYHEWMQQADIQEATASEPLTIDEEFTMQESWRTDADKLTFIICSPIVVEQTTRATAIDASERSLRARVYDKGEAMIGDVNMFISLADGEQDEESRVVGELELMIAEKGQQGKGAGRAALVTFLRYVLQQEEDLVREFALGIKEKKLKSKGIAYLCAKVGEKNYRSLKLFESLGFRRTPETPSFFGEFELRYEGMSLEIVEGLIQKHGIEEYTVMNYEGEDV